MRARSKPPNVARFKVKFALGGHVRTRGTVYRNGAGYDTDAVWIEFPDGRTAAMMTRPNIRGCDVSNGWILYTVGEIMKRRNTSEPRLPSTTDTVADDFAILYPQVLQWMTERRYDDGTARTPGSISIFSPDEGGLRACVTDKDTGEIAFVSGRSISELFERLQHAIAEDRLDWRKAKPHAVRRK